MKPAIYSKEYAAFEKEESFHKCEGGIHYYNFDEWYFQNEDDLYDCYSDFFDYFFDYDLDFCDEPEVSNLYDESYDYDWGDGKMGKRAKTMEIGMFVL